MNVQCSNCRTKYKVDETRISAPVFQFKCKKCGAMTKVEKNVERKSQKTQPKKHRNEPPYFLLRMDATRGFMNLAGYWSYPVFIRENQEQINWLYLVLTMVPNYEKKITGLYRPKASLVTRAHSAMIVRYEDFRNGSDPFQQISWQTPLGVYPHQPVKGLDPGSLAEKERALIHACEKESKGFAQREALSNSFARQWLELTHPVFIRFLKPLAPEFMSTLAKSIKEGSG